MKYAILQAMKLLLTSILLATTLLLPASTARYDQPSIPESKLKAHQARVKLPEDSTVDHFSLKLLKGAEGRRLVKKYRVAGTKHKKTVKELDANTHYYVRLKAYYKDGTASRYSKKVGFTTDASTTPPQFGVNFIRFFSDENAELEAATQPAAVESDFNALGVQLFRQITSADLIWSNVAATNGTYNFTEQDQVLPNTDHTPVVTLFSNQYADSTSPADEIRGDDTPETTLTDEAADYVATVVDRYKDNITYWEIGNEMAHWELNYPGQFPPEEQGLWLKAVAEVIKAHDPDAQIVLPGLINITEENVDDWLVPVVESAGSDWFDIVGYHHYNRWQQFNRDHSALLATLDDLGISDKTVWLTETGVSSDSTNTNRTDYPNSETQQAADIFRRALLAYAAGDEAVIWHTYIGNDDDGEEFRYFGLVNEDLTPQLSYYSTQLLTDQLLPFTSVVQDEDFGFTITKTNGDKRYVAWSATTDTWIVPAGVTEYTSVVSNASGDFDWTAVSAGDEIALSTIPILAR